MNTLHMLMQQFARQGKVKWIGLRASRGEKMHSVGSVEAANAASFIWMFPITFLSSAFVSTASMPDWLQPVADHNPFTRLANASRALYNGFDPGANLWWAIGWIIIPASYLADSNNNLL